MSDSDFEVHEIGAGQAIASLGYEVAELKKALRKIVDMESCLLADAKHIAAEALLWAELNEQRLQELSSSRD
jgi:hypothetical protein